MPEPQDPNPSGSDPAADEGGAGRFWQRYASTRATRSEARSGEPANGNGATEPDPEPGGARPAGDHECLEWCPICRGAEVLRAGAPSELRDQWQTVQRDALVGLRGLIDAYLQHIGEAERPERDVEDIPIS